MKHEKLDPAPKWAEHNMPRKNRRNVPSIMLIYMGVEDGFEVATREDLLAYFKPGAFLHRIVRANALYMSLQDFWNN